MNEIIALVGLFIISLLSPIMIRFFNNLVDLIDKSTLKNPIGYLVGSTARSLGKSLVYKTELNVVCSIIIFTMILTTKALLLSVWFDFLSIYKLPMNIFLLALLFTKLLTFLFFFNYSRRINTTDIIIQLSNYFVFFILACSIYHLGAQTQNLTLVFISIITLMFVDLLLLIRIEKILAVQSLFLKYIFELIKFGHSLVLVNICLSFFQLPNDIKVILLIFIPILITFYVHLYFGRTLNSKFQGMNKKQDRLLVSILLLTLFIGSVL